MTSVDRNDPVPAQEKLQWVTPKISLMEAGDTEGKIFAGGELFNKSITPTTGPS